MADTTARYEQLRSAVLSGQGEGWRLGWGVLASRGMAAWMTAQRHIPVAPQHNPHEHTDHSTAAPPARAAELVRVLASMALAHLRRPNTINLYAIKEKTVNTSAASAAGKITHEHLRRDAYLYVRQSTLKQVLSNTESTARQYGLRGRAIALGWAESQIIVIDTDQGQSGASAADREGFQRLVADVGMGHAGIVLGLEVSRLARNNTDWHRLLEICALAGTLILDEDGLYDPANFNDRLLLGLKGTMSEAELHFLKARLRGGVLSKARRGELVQALPVGLVYDLVGKVVLDPDVSVQGPVARVFTTFTATGSALAVVKAFAADGLLFPRRLKTGPRKGELAWGQLQHSRVLQVLHNPRYAGAFFYGRRTDSRRADGTMTTRVLPREEWTVLITDAHPGYISWEQFEATQARLAANASAHGQDRRASPPREGPALLQGLVICGKCGGRMTVRYHVRNGNQVPEYVCQSDGIQHGKTDLPTHPRRRDRHRCEPVPPGHCHPAGAGDRAGRRRRTHRPRRRRRPHPRHRRPTRPIPRRPGPAPLPRGRPRQPAGRRPTRSRLERHPARARRGHRHPRARPQQ